MSSCFPFYCLCVYTIQSHFSFLLHFHPFFSFLSSVFSLAFAPPSFSLNSHSFNPVWIAVLILSGLGSGSPSLTPHQSTLLHPPPSPRPGWSCLSSPGKQGGREMHNPGIGPACMPSMGHSCAEQSCRSLFLITSGAWREYCMLCCYSGNIAGFYFL